jgi:hypothetical protein
VRRVFHQIDSPGIPLTHDMVYGSYSLPSFPDTEDLRKFYREYKNKDLEALMNDVSNLDWSNFFAAADVNAKVHIFNSCSAEEVQTRVNPWFNEEIEKTMRERETFFTLFGG